MSTITTDNTYYSDIGNAIRAQLESTQMYTPAQMANAILNISNVKGIKGDAETEYRTGYVSLSPENIGALGVHDNAESATKLASPFKLTINNVTKSTDGTSDLSYTSEELKLLRIEADEADETLIFKIK
jgi:hypothetical protein